jgi:VWFA-related protein
MVIRDRAAGILVWGFMSAWKLALLAKRCRTLGRYNTCGHVLRSRRLSGLLRTGTLLLSACAAGTLAGMDGVRVENGAGGVTVRPAAALEATYRTTTLSGTKPACSSEVAGDPPVLMVRCPAGGPAVEVEVDLPIGMPFAAVTGSGPIVFSGLSRVVNLSTDTGDVRICVPWSMVRLSGFSLMKPKSVSSSRAIVVRTLDQPKQWLVSAGKGPSPNEALLGSYYGEVFFRGGSPGRLELVDTPVPEFSWIKPPSEAVSVLNTWRKPPASRGAPSSGSAGRSSSSIQSDGLPVFSAEVRMVSLSVSVADAAGRPATALVPGDFEVREGRAIQNLTSAGTDEVPFNLVLLLDLSGSTKAHREAMKAAARRFIGVARQRDRVAVYALAKGLFYVISRLSQDHNDLLGKIDAIPMVEGETPLYDAIVLSCAEELMQRPQERNALIVITDGVDSALQDEKPPGRSLVKPSELRKAAEGIPLLIYPVLVGVNDLPIFARTARQNMAEVAEATGGRVFEAESLEDLEPVYTQVADELRSVYTLSYYPSNQNFDGRWRSLTVRVKRPGLKVRARSGYYAQ